MVSDWFSESQSETEYTGRLADSEIQYQVATDYNKGFKKCEHKSKLMPELNGFIHIYSWVMGL